MLSQGGKPGWPRVINVDTSGNPPTRVIFAVAGFYPYFCGNHPGVMDGLIVVIEDEGGGSP